MKGQVAWRDGKGDFYRHQSPLFRCSFAEELKNYFAEMWGCGTWDPLRCEFLALIHFVSASAERII
jgi:hypothetical protein